MARLPRLALPGIPYHVTQRGNRRGDLFRRQRLCALPRSARPGGGAGRRGDLVLLPDAERRPHRGRAPADEDGLRRTFADTHRRYTGFIDARARWTGHLWQGRFGAVAMDEGHLANAMRYVTLNPVRAKLVARAEHWRWSSAAAHLAGKDDDLVTVAPAIERYGDFAAFLGEDHDDEIAWRRLRMAETSGRPLGSEAWLEEIEASSGRTLRPRKRGATPFRKASRRVGNRTSVIRGHCACHSNVSNRTI